MPDDIVDAAQKAINDAANTVPGVTNVPIPPTPTAGMPPMEPAPVPPMPEPIAAPQRVTAGSVGGIPLADIPVTPAPNTATSIPEPKPAIPPTSPVPNPEPPPVPPPTPIIPPAPESVPTPIPEPLPTPKPEPSITPGPVKTEAAPIPPEPVIPPPEVPKAAGTAQPPEPKKSGKKGKKAPVAGIIAGIFMLLAIGAGALYVANPQQLADIRSLAGPNNGYSQGGKWKIEEGCKGSGCVHDAQVNQAQINYNQAISSGTSAEAAKQQYIADIAKAYASINQIAPGVSIVKVNDPNTGKPIDLSNVNTFTAVLAALPLATRQKMPLPAVTGGYSKSDVLAWYNPGGTNAGLSPGQLGYVNKDGTIAGFYQPSAGGGVSTNWWPVTASTGNNNGGGGNNTIVPTATPILKCDNLQILKDSKVVTDPTTLSPGDAVVIDVKSTVAATDAHFKINGSAWNKYTTKVSDTEYQYAYTIADTASFQIDAQVQINGNWY